MLVEVRPCLSELLPAPLAELEPELVEQLAFYLKERSVDPRALSSAAIKAAKHVAVDFSSGDPVSSVSLCDGRVTGVITTKTSFLAPKVVNCAGAWSGQIPPHSFPTRPVKGQMLCLAMPTRNLLKHVIRSPKAYLIPRSDGRLLVTGGQVGTNQVGPTLSYVFNPFTELWTQIEDMRKGRWYPSNITLGDHKIEYRY